MTEPDETGRAFPRDSREDLRTLERVLVELARSAEDLLDALRSRTLVPAPETTAALVDLIDATRARLVRMQMSAARHTDGPHERVALDDPRERVAQDGSPKRPASPPEHPGEAAGVSMDADEPSLLLATGAGGAHLAVTLSAVQRLEQFAPEQLRRSGDGDVIRYGDTILPVLWVTDLLSSGSGERSDPQAPRAQQAETIVCLSSAGPVGLVVDCIEDVVPRPRVPAQPSSRPGVACRLVIAGQATELLDIEGLVVAARNRGQSL